MSRRASPDITRHVEAVALAVRGEIALGADSVEFEFDNI
jgi:hypothetical protein